MARDPNLVILFSNLARENLDLFTLLSSILNILLRDFFHEIRQVLIRFRFQQDDGSVTLEQGEDVDSSYHYYDNLRGKINNRILTDLVRSFFRNILTLCRNVEP